MLLNLLVVNDIQGRKLNIDRTDRKILAELQRDGRQSLTDLAERIGLSLSPCHRRVRALEDAGVILGYRAELCAKELGLSFSSIVFVTLREGHHQAVLDFESALQGIPQIVQAQRLFGDPDYLLQVITADLPTFQKLYDEHLSRLPNVLRLTSTLVMKSVIESRSMPVSDVVGP